MATLLHHKKVIFDEKKFSDFEALIFGGLGRGLANIWTISGTTIRSNCNIEFHLHFSTHFDVFSLDLRPREKK